MAEVNRSNQPFRSSPCHFILLFESYSPLGISAITSKYQVSEFSVIPYEGITKFYFNSDSCMRCKFSGVSRISHVNCGDIFFRPLLMQCVNPEIYRKFILIILTFNRFVYNIHPSTDREYPTFSRFFYFLKTFHFVSVSFYPFLIQNS